MILPPKNIQKIGQELAIIWNDDTETFIPLERLRRECPCATCRGEPDVLGRLQNLQQQSLTCASFELMGWQLVGNYGLQPKWADGHHSGIFIWEHLRNLWDVA